MSAMRTMRRTRARTRRAAPVVAASLVASLGALIPAEHAVASPPGSGGDVMSFGKWDQNISDSALYIYDNGSHYSTQRAGSGNGNLDECVSSAGPLPDGTYSGTSTWHQDAFSGSAIYGRVYRLQNKACYNGTVRTALFIHTEETPSRTQGSTEPQRWDGNNDYYSLGCIKVSRPGAPGNGADSIGVLDTWWHQKAGGGVGTAYYNLINVYWL